MAIYEIKKEPVSLLISKFVLLLCFIGSLMTVSSVALFVYTKDIRYPRKVNNIVNNIVPVVKSIEISSDGKAVLDSETKEAIFTTDDANKYLRDSGYYYNPDTFQTTNAKYEGDCFTSATLSNTKDRIIFSTGCLPGDLPQAWGGYYDFTQPACNSASKICLDIMAKERIKFLTGGSGKNFVWSEDDKTITYEADLGLSGMTETRTIDSTTGEIQTKTSENKTDGILLYVSDGDLWQADANGKTNVRLIDKDVILRAEMSPNKNNIAYSVNTKVRHAVTTYEGKKEERDLDRNDLLLADRNGANSYLVKEGVMRWGWVSSIDLLWYESSELGQFMDWTYLGNDDVWVFDAKAKKSNRIAKDDVMLGVKWSFDGSKILYVGYKNDKNGKFENLSLRVVDRSTSSIKDLFDIPYVGGDRGGPPPFPSFYWNSTGEFIYTAFTPLLWDKNDPLAKKFKSGYLTGWKIPADGSEPTRIFPDIPSDGSNDETYPGVVFNEDFSKVAYTRYRETDVKDLEPNKWFYGNISRPLSLVVLDLKNQKEKVLIEDIKSKNGLNKFWSYPHGVDNKEMFFSGDYLYILTGEKKQNEYGYLLTLKKIDIANAESQDFKIELTAKTQYYPRINDVGYSENLDAVYFDFEDKAFYFYEKQKSFIKILDNVQSIVFDI